MNSRGIEANRFFLTGFGGVLDEGGDQYYADYLQDSPVYYGAPRQVDLNYDSSVDYDSTACNVQRFGTAQEFHDSIVVQDSLQSGENFAGFLEDGWWGIHQAAKGVDGIRSNSNYAPLCGTDTDTDGFVETLYDFRKNAAVHFVLVSEEPSSERLRTTGEASFEATLEDMLDILEKQSLRDSDNLPNQIADAVVTTIVPAMFTIPGISDPIMGVDADIFDGWDVDVDTAVPTGAPDQQAHVFVSDGPNSVDVITTNQDILESYWQNGNSIAQKDANYAGDVLRVLSDPNVPYLGDRNHAFNASNPVEHIGQRHFFAERYAFLAWETGGTVWDIEHAVGKLLKNSTTPWTPDEVRLETNPNGVFGPNERTGIETPFFREAVIDDIFEKIRLQTVNLDDQGGITLEGEIMAFWDAAMQVNTNPTSHNIVIPRFDLDGDGDFVSNGQIDPDDISRLILILGTRFGDSNFDFQFDSSDFVTVFGVEEFEDSVNDNSTWADGDWSGNFDFDSGDFVVVFTAGSFEDGYLDEDNDGIPDVLPIWEIDITFTGVIDYLPTWGF
ncbi:MAG: hypothetical protein KDA87_05370 [Planctomycetales bacterium]|nr:hypothetical protein [Planctomycetales bacterium]